MPRVALALLVVTLLSGCHARFKRHAGSLGDVRTQVMNPRGPDVYLGKIHDDSLAAVVVNTVQIGQEYKAERIIREAVDPDTTAYALQLGIAEALGSGPPFAYTDQDTAGGTLQLEVRDWGMTVPYLGAQGVFDYKLRTRIYRSSDGRLVYKANTRCTTAAGAPPGVSVALGTVNNVRQLEEMEPAEIQAAFDAVAKWCGVEVTRKMRRHAG